MSVLSMLLHVVYLKSAFWDFSLDDICYTSMQDRSLKSFYDIKSMRMFTFMLKTLLHDILCSALSFFAYNLREGTGMVNSDSKIKACTL